MNISRQWCTALLCLLSSAVGAKEIGGRKLSENRDLYFLENKGQIHDQHGQPRPDVQFVVPSRGMNVFIGSGQLHYQFHQASQRNLVNQLGPSYLVGKQQDQHIQTATYRMDVTLIGANLNGQLIKDEQDEFSARFCTATATGRNSALKQVSNLEANAWHKITYKDVYPNIDWVVYTKGEALEYEFIVRPGGNPADIRLKYDGSTGLEVMPDGGLLATTPMGTVTENAPYSYTSDGKAVASSFSLRNNELSFNVGSYTGTLVIDPSLTWGTYYGGFDWDNLEEVAADAAGNVYATGSTTSLSNIATSGAYQGSISGTFDAHLVKFSAAGSRLWSTYFGVTDGIIGASDFAAGIDLSNNQVFITLNTDYFGDFDAVVASFDASGSYGSGVIIGGTGAESAVALAHDSNGDIYNVGVTGSTPSIATFGAHQDFFGGGTRDGYVMKIASNLDPSLISWITSYGGTGDEAFTDIAIDGADNIYLSGWTTSTNDIASAGGGSLNGFADGIMVRFNTGGFRQWGHYIGGSGDEEARNIATDANGDIYLLGNTGSSSGIATPGAFQSTNAGGSISLSYDAFLAKYNSAAVKQWGTYYGGNQDESAQGIGMLGTDVVIGGTTPSTTGLSFPGSYQPLYGGGLEDGFMAKFSSTGTHLWGTYYGGPDDDALFDITTGAGNIYVTGATVSMTGIASANGWQPSYNGNADAYVSQFSDCGLPAQPSSITGPAAVCEGSSNAYSIPAVTGATSYTWTLPAGFTGSSTTTSISVTAGAGATGGTLTVEANNACGTGPAVTQSLTVVPVPVATITPAGVTTFCAGGNVVLDATSGTGLSYQWRFSNVNVPAATNSSYTAASGGIYAVIVSAGAGCADTSADLTVTVNPAPAVPVVTPSITVCTGQTINLTATSITPGVGYIWTGPNSYLSLVQNPVILNATAVQAGVYTVTTEVAGCSSSATTTVAVSGSAPATPVTISGNNTVCSGSTQTYTVPNDPSVTSYSWTLPTGWVGTSTTNSITVTVGTVSGAISVLANNGCGSSAAQIFTVTASPAPTVTITQSGATLSTTTAFTSYQWYFNSVLIPGANSQSYTAMQTGDYFVVASDGVCFAQSNILTISVTGINNVGRAGLISLYPNPNNGIFTLQGTMLAGGVTLSVIDISGRVLYQQPLDVNNSTINQTIDVSSFAAGAYMVRVVTAGGSSTIPFIRK
jgi:hypothetical protein